MTGPTLAARRILALAFGCSPAEVPEDSRLGHPAAWDSIGHMRLILELETVIGRMLTPEDIVALETMADVAQLLTKAGASTEP